MVEGVVPPFASTFQGKSHEVIQPGEPSYSQPRPETAGRPSFKFIADRVLLATFTVTNNAVSGPGSLDQAILNAEHNPVTDTSKQVIIDQATPAFSLHDRRSIHAARVGSMPDSGWRHNPPRPTGL